MTPVESRACDRVGAHTAAVSAPIPLGAQITVVARRSVRAVHASGRGVAGVIRTRIVVVATGWCAADTPAIPAAVSGRTGVAVVAGRPVARRRVGACAGIRITGAGAMTRVERRTDHRLGAGAPSLHAGVVAGAEIAVVARARDRAVATPARGLTRVLGARVSIVTIEGHATRTAPVPARIVRRAGAAVIARGRVAGVDAAGRGGAGVVRAGVAVVAMVWRIARALTLDTSIVGGAGVAVVARLIGIDVDTAHLGVTGVVGAGVPVVAGRRGPAGAAAIRADVTACAGIPIIAAHSIVEVNTTLLTAAGIVGTGVPVVAVDGCATSALSIAADVIARARAAVVAGGGVGRSLATRAGLARIVRACIPVVTIGWGAAAAAPTGASVVEGARTAVVAGPGVGAVHAARGPLAGIICADVVVVAVRRGTAQAASPGAAVVARTGVAIVAGLRVAGVNASCDGVA